MSEGFFVFKRLLLMRQEERQRLFDHLRVHRIGKGGLRNRTDPVINTQSLPTKVP